MKWEWGEVVQEQEEVKDIEEREKIRIKKKKNIKRLAT